MRFLLSFLILLSFTLHSSAQELTVRTSQYFEAPTEGMFRVLQMKNGNTVLLQFTLKNGLFVSVFDSTGKMTANKNYDNSIWTIKTLKPANVDGVFAVGDEAVIFINTHEEKVPKLYRIRINSENGSIIEEKDFMATLRPGGLKRYGRNTIKYMYVAKDDYSDAYAVFCYNNLPYTGDKNTLYLFNGKHELVNKVEIDIAEDKKYTEWRYAGMVVDGTKGAYVAMQGAFRILSGTNPKISLFKLSNESQDVIRKDFLLPTEYGTNNIFIKRNPVNNTVEVLASYTTDASSNYFTNKEKLYYRMKFFALGADSLDYKSTTMVGVNKIESSLSDKKNRKVIYHGTPKDLKIGADGNSSILFEEFEILSEVKAITGAIGILDIAANGETQKGLGILKEQICGPSIREKNSILERYERISKHDVFSFSYFPGRNGRFVFYNDLETNVANAKTTSVASLTDPESAQPVYYNLDKNNAPALLFPHEQNVNRYILTNAGNYNDNTGRYATIMFEKYGRKSSACVIWIN